MLTLPDVTYLGGYPDRATETHVLTAVFDRSGIALRRRIRRFLAFRWADLRGLDVRTPGIATFITAMSLRHLDAGGSSMDLYLDHGVCRLHVSGTPSAELRKILASWVAREAGPPKPLPAMPPPHPRELAGPLDAVRVSLDVWRAASLGREPIHDRTTLAYRLAVAEDHRQCGRVAEALALLEPLAAEAARSFGPADENTLKVRNALGQTYLAAGDVDDGMDVLREVVAAAEHRHGADGDLTLVFRNNLAVGYQNAGQYADAIDLHEQNVRYTEQKLGGDNVETVGRRNNLAAALALAGYRERAIGRYWEVVDSMHTAGRNHSLAVNARQNLAILHNPSWKP